MADIRMHNIAHRYPHSEADALALGDFIWRDGGAYALLGPSGCGKTTLLNIISGLLIPSRGQVLFDERDVTALDPRARNIAQVFQFPVVYDNLSVFDNLAFPLRNRGMDKNAIAERVQEIAGLLELSSILRNKARGLSADQKQLISLGRGLVRNDVSAILFDEPLTVIDPHQKFKLRRILKDIHRQFNLTLIYVTHDQSEALTFADVVAVMNDGVVLQSGSPEDLYNSPAHRFVGHFIGNPGMNFIPVICQGDGVLIDNVAVPMENAILKKAQSLAGDACIGVRPEYLSISAHSSAEDALVSLPVAITGIENHGTHLMLNGQVLGRQIMVKAHSLPSAEQLYLHLPKGMSKLYIGDQLVE